MNAPNPLRHAAPPIQRVLLGLLVLLACVTSLAPQALGQPRLRIATFNAENYLVRPANGRPMKPLPQRGKVAELLSDLSPDVVALQEIGDPDALSDLQGRLRSRGIDLPHADLARGHDPDIAIAILSRFPFDSRVHHTNDSYLLDGRRLRASRAFSEVSFQPAPGYRVFLLAAHLKSKRAVGIASESDMREQEAILLREKAEAILHRDPDANLVVCGDFNDTQESPALRVLRGKGTRALIDTKPAEPSPSPASPRRITWTHHFARDDAFTRIDYILVSRGMAREWRPEGTRVHPAHDWGMASDHRPIVAEFDAADR